MAWCEENRVHYVFGLAKNERLAEQITQELVAAETEAKKTGAPARRFKEFMWETLDSWSRKRRVIGKAEWTKGEANPRFIVLAAAGEAGTAPTPPPRPATAPTAKSTPR
jgi:hypothetical protein